MAEPHSELAAPEQNNLPASALQIRSLDDIRRLSLIFVESGMFKGDAKATQEQKLYQAGVKIIAGVEFGIQPFAAMRGINIIGGNAEMSSNLMAAKVKSHPKYDYDVTQWDAEGCVLTFYEIPPGTPRESWRKLGESSFDAKDAATAGLDRGDNWRKFARNMYFARAMSNGVRIYCPDIFYGAPVYVEGEISGEIVVQDDAPAEAVQKQPEDDAHQPDAVQEAEIVEPPEPKVEQPPADVEDDSTPTDPNAKAGSLLSSKQLGRIHILFGELGITEKSKRQEINTAIAGRAVESSADLTKAEAIKVIDALTRKLEEKTNAENQD